MFNHKKTGMQRAGAYSGLAKPINNNMPNVKQNTRWVPAFA